MNCLNDIIRDKDLVYLVNSKGGGLLNIKPPSKTNKYDI
jgi:hypothetical protein